MARPIAMSQSMLTTGSGVAKQCVRRQTLPGFDQPHSYSALGDAIQWVSLELGAA